jgi:hypothetical protein
MQKRLVQLLDRVINGMLETVLVIAIVRDRIAMGKYDPRIHPQTGVDNNEK